MNAMLPLNPFLKPTAEWCFAFVLLTAGKTVFEAAEKRNAYMREWNRKNPDRVRISKRKEAIKNAARYKAWQREYYRKNKRAFLDRANRNNKRRYQIDTQYRIKKDTQRMMLFALAGQKKWKRSHEILGCTWADFVKHIESTFTKGMTWANRGVHGWHIDHIRPQSKFDLTDRQEFQRCFHFTNMRASWHHDNCTKWNKIGPQYKNTQPSLML